MLWKWQNKMVQFNESMLSLSVICLSLMTDIILDPYGKYVTGFFPTTFMIMTVLYGGILVLLNLIKWVILILRQQWNRLHYREKKKEYAIKYKYYNQEQIEVRLREINQR